MQTNGEEFEVIFQLGYETPFQTRQIALVVPPSQ